MDRSREYQLSLLAITVVAVMLPSCDKTDSTVDDGESVRVRWVFFVSVHSAKESEGAMMKQRILDRIPVANRHAEARCIAYKYYAEGDYKDALRCAKDTKRHARTADEEGAYLLDWVHLARLAGDDAYIRERCSGAKTPGNQTICEMQLLLAEGELKKVLDAPLPGNSNNEQRQWYHYLRMQALHELGEHEKAWNEVLKMWPEALDPDGNTRPHGVHGEVAPEIMLGSANVALAAGHTEEGRLLLAKLRFVLGHIQTDVSWSAMKKRVQELIDGLPPATRKLPSWLEPVSW